ncbi:organic solvent ABC transporter permease [Marinobacter caseinilyticus]|uniref:organic solvent ABC transporter permease n=1 Tax=Marinobacter caseinilyticus TaxID=2692195 RepID=UPI001F2BEA6C|nr:organic solvent ABC transporter permease [Marinobacter caseinilyticus]
MKLAHLILISACALSGCLDGGGSDGDDRSTGQITPTGVEGLQYQTASQTGKTDSRGTFRYYQGERVDLRVGSLSLFSKIPANRFLTPLDFVPSVRAQLENAELTDEGLLSHQPKELQLIETLEVINVTRFILSLNWERSVSSGQGVDIRNRTIGQLNVALPSLESTIDFSAGQAEFSEPVQRGLATGEITSGSPANRLLDAICFYSVDSELCVETPTISEIENAPEPPDNDEDRDPDIRYQDDLRNLRERILAGKREIGDVGLSDVREYLKRELDSVSRRIANQYYLDASTAQHPASDTRIHKVQIRKIAGEPSLDQIEAISTNPLNVIVHSYDRQSATVEYFIDGDGGEEGEILINFKPTGDYRWVKKQIRVVIKS